jgi:DNA-binding GntR family transcriptional regulator
VVALFPTHKEHSLDDHEELLVALTARDAERARSIAEGHVLDAGRSLADWLDPSMASTRDVSLREHGQERR